ncbi:hypothetical protein [Paractinoplanes hotanensis]|uniref:Uncharacterized protein n=1 Tax=Paractinoplanes hotanensis TaxID=2906497 RepID=A0ABT0XYE6_9ACTN|nr:hypothetical protein [Actinoplanes hotanensis]MCM4078818.1 hypothetical protein [Actinoplanes hotanensis]
MQQIADQYRDADSVSVAIICTRPDGTSVDPKSWMPAPRTRPAPIPAMAGPRWTDLLIQLTESAFITDEVAAEADQENSAPPDGTAHRKLVDAISIKLGGPQHPKL